MIFEPINTAVEPFVGDTEPTVGLTVSVISGKAIANLEYLSVKHLNPVFLNDTISVKTIIIDKKETKSKKDRGIIHVLSEVTNQNNEIVLSFERKVLIKKRNEL